MIDIKTYTFRELILEYGPEKMNTIKVKWNAPQQKFNIILGGVEVRNSFKAFSDVCLHFFTSFLHFKILLSIRIILIFFFQYFRKEQQCVLTV